MPRPAAVLLIVITLVIPAALDAQGRSYEGRLRVGGRDRTYLVDLPPRYDGRTALPLVLFFHGGGGNARQARRQYGMTELARREGFIVVYPNGSGRVGGRLLTWDAGTCCGFARDRGIDEAAFVRALLDTLQATLRIDPARVYATGISNGGMMSYLAACALGGRIAAVGVVAGELTMTDCRPPRPVAVLAIHGTADDHLPFGGGRGSASLDPHDTRPVSHATDTWRRIDGCTAAPSVRRDGVVTHTRYGGCAAGTAVELYAIEGGGHSWPGAAPPRVGRRRRDPPSRAMDATQTIWRFFAAHPAH
jgi:polyhydroxybutyrate depolymerase